MRILWYFRAWTKESTKPITLWVEAKNQGAARNLIFRENPFIQLVPAIKPAFLQNNKNRIIMEAKYVLILDFTIGCLNIIELTDEELKASEEYEDFSDFLSTLEDKYGFRLSNSQWMTTETLSIYHYKDGKEVADAELV